MSRRLRNKGIVVTDRWLKYRASESLVIDKPQFVAVGWLLLLAVVLVFIAPDVDLPSTVMQSQHSFRPHSTVPATHASNLILGTPDPVRTLSGLPQRSAIIAFAADHLLTLECTLLC